VPDPTGAGPKYTPGMEGDPNGAILENWSSPELEMWFRENVESDHQYGLEADWSGPNRLDKFPEETREGLRAIHATASEKGERIFGHDSAKAFGRLSPEIRDAFFFAWMKTHPGPNPSIELEEVSSENAQGADLAAVGALITLPDGTQITDDMTDPDYEPSGADGPPPSEAAAPTSGAGVLPLPWWRTSKAMGWAAVGVVTVVVAAGAATIIGGSDSTDDSQQQASGQAAPSTTTAPSSGSSPDTTVAPDAPANDSQVTDQPSDAPKSAVDSADDPVGDVSQAFPDLDGVDPDRSVDGVSGQSAIDNADITELTVVSNADGNTTTIAIGFNGDDLRGCGPRPWPR
jgi:hypothetical protein